MDKRIIDLVKVAADPELTAKVRVIKDRYRNRGKDPKVQESKTDGGLEALRSLKNMNKAIKGQVEHGFPGNMNWRADRLASNKVHADTGIHPAHQPKGPKALMDLRATNESILKSKKGAVVPGMHAQSSTRSYAEALARKAVKSGANKDKVERALRRGQKTQEILAKD